MTQSHLAAALEDRARAAQRVEDARLLRAAIEAMERTLEVWPAESDPSPYSPGREWIEALAVECPRKRVNATVCAFTPSAVVRAASWMLGSAPPSAPRVAGAEDSHAPPVVVPRSRADWTRLRRGKEGSAFPPSEPPAPTNPIARKRLRILPSRAVCGSGRETGRRTGWTVTRHCAST